MSVSDNLHTITLPAAADLSAKQYYAVKVDSSGNAALAGAGDRAAGILQNAPAAAGRAATIATGGRTKAVAGGSITAGNFVASDSNGKLVAETTGDNITVGIALSDGASGKIFDVLIQPMALTV